MSTPEPQSAQPDPSAEQPDEADKGDETGDQTTRDDVSDNLPLPNDPVDASGLMSADDLNGEAPD